MRRFLSTIVALACMPFAVPREMRLDRERRRERTPARTISWGDRTLPMDPTEPCGVCLALRVRRRANMYKKINTGHWRRYRAPVECVSVDGDWATVTRTDGSSVSGPKHLVLAGAS